MGATWPTAEAAGLNFGGLSVEGEEAVESPQDEKKAANRPLRTKVSTKEFQKYDIDPDKPGDLLRHRRCGAKRKGRHGMKRGLSGM